MSIGDILGVAVITLLVQWVVAIKFEEYMTRKEDEYD